MGTSPSREGLEVTDSDSDYEHEEEETEHYEHAKTHSTRELTNPNVTLRTIKRHVLCFEAQRTKFVFC